MIDPTNTITVEEIDDLITHMNIHYDDKEIPLSVADNDLIIEALENYKEIIQKENNIG